MTVMLPPFVNAEMFEVLPIYISALLLGLVSGVVVVRLLTAGLGRLWPRALIGGATLAALLSSLIAVKPEAWTATAEFWALAAAGMATLDLAVVCLLASWRTIPRSADRHIHRIAAWLPLWLPLASAALLASIRLSFDLGPMTLSPLTLITVVVVIVVPVAFLDLTARLVAIGRIRWRRTRDSGYYPGS
jgi:hypothetical protein